MLSCVNTAMKTYDYKVHYNQRLTKILFISDSCSYSIQSNEDLHGTLLRISTSCVFRTQFYRIFGKKNKHGLQFLLV